MLENRPRGVGAHLHALAPAGYLLAAVLVAFPLSEVAVAVQPLRALDPSWRYGALGYLSRALMTPMLGLGLGVVVAVACRHDRFSFALCVTCFVTSGLLLAAAALFVLDALELVDLLREELTTAYLLTSAQAFLKFLVASVVLLVLGLRLPKRRRQARV